MKIRVMRPGELARLFRTGRLVSQDTFRLDPQPYAVPGILLTLLALVGLMWWNG